MDVSFADLANILTHVHVHLLISPLPFLWQLCMHSQLKFGFRKKVKCQYCFTAIVYIRYRSGNHPIAKILKVLHLTVRSFTQSHSAIMERVIYSSLQALLHGPEQYFNIASSEFIRIYNAIGFLRKIVYICPQYSLHSASADCLIVLASCVHVSLCLCSKGIYVII